ncbi:hypothetical protein DH2020_042055 [Rehmannia glutinosa]|uniref:TCP domain-containing protein n=1 Tax=Rehmannia glutinosa TaxID=99300 RepID=A0ABR0UNG3_REHGL
MVQSLSPSDERGLGLRDVHSWNKALLAKNLWNIHSKGDSFGSDGNYHQLQPPLDEEAQLEELEDGDNPQNFSEKSLNAQSANTYDLVSPGAISKQSSGPKKRLIMQKAGFSLAPSQKLKAKRRKTEIIEIHGGRIIRSAGRKDRHSKVCTARGTRDRRVRLSPKTAIQFYDVQDRLGYDRPSKAIDWLMKEAKAAIDALIEPPPEDTNYHFGSGNGEIQEPQPEISPNFGLFNNNGGAPLVSTEFQAYSNSDFNSVLYSRNHEGFLSSAPPLTTPSEIFDANFEMAKMQRIFTWNYANSIIGAEEDYSSVITPNFPGPPILGHSQVFQQREPLQSSYSRISYNYNPITARFPGIDFSNEEMPDFTTADKEDETNKIPIFGEQSSTAPFLHYEE